MTITGEDTLIYVLYLYGNLILCLPASPSSSVISIRILYDPTQLTPIYQPKRYAATLFLVDMATITILINDSQYLFPD